MNQPGRKPGWRATLHEIIFEADTPAGRTFDLLLILTILLSTLAVMLESMQVVRQNWSQEIRIAEWLFTILFTIEYILRLMTVKRPLRYATSFFGVVDLMAVLPTYISLVLPGAQYLLVLRFLRILRVFRVLKLALYLKEGEIILRALRASQRKITVFLFGVLSAILILGSLMYMIEGEANGFTSIPKSIYWAIVTMTTVGYGDIAPQTTVGQFLAACMMILGYAIIAVPTGIVSVEMRGAMNQAVSTQACPSCSKEGHEVDARFCKHCGSSL